MTKQEIVSRLRKAYECEEAFPGVLGNPRVFAGRWGLIAASPVENDKAKSNSSDASRRSPGMRYHIVRADINAPNVKKHRSKYAVKRLVPAA